MIALILAGGKGARLGAAAKGIPKPLVKIKDKPLLEHQIELLKRYGIKEIFILAQYKYEPIKEYFKDGRDFGVHIDYAIEDTPLGTAGGIKNLEDKLSGDFLVLYGDVMVNMDLGRLISFHRSKKGICTLVLHPNSHPCDSDLAEIDSAKRIIAFYPKPRDDAKYCRNLVNAGLYVFSSEMLRHIDKGAHADFGRDIFPKIVDREYIYGYVTAEYLKDMGTPDRLKQVQGDYASGKPASLNIENKRSAIFLDRDGVINKEIGLLYRMGDFELVGQSADALRKINDSEFLAIVATNQSVVARNLCSIEELEIIHRKMETLLGREGAYLDGIYYCPHHPDKGHPEENAEYKIECGCRKPKTGMIDKAAADFNIDLRSSFIIGDSSRDIGCGKAAGLVTVGLRTGHGCKENIVEPDFFFDNIRDAVHFIIGRPYAPYIEKIKTAYLNANGKKPFLISIGGNTRSGKTIFAKCLAGAFRRNGKKVLTVQLDDWILPKEQRSKEHGVYERFRFDRLRDDITALLGGQKVILEKYNCLTRQTSDNGAAYQLSGEDIVIMEGVIALSADVLRGLSDLRIFINIDERLMVRRISDFYLWKGLRPDEIDSLIKTRRRDEYNVIRNDSRYADMIVSGAAA